VAAKLTEVAEAFPFPPQPEHIGDEERRRRAAAALRAARDAEAAGLRALEAVAAEL